MAANFRSHLHGYLVQPVRMDAALDEITMQSGASETAAEGRCSLPSGQPLSGLDETSSRTLHCLAKNGESLVLALEERLDSLQETFMSVCNGASLLAAAGILDGRPATTNKMAFKTSTAPGPKVNWIAKARWVDDGTVVTSSGVSAGMRVGLTARQAAAEGGSVAVSLSPLLGNAIAQAGGDAAGFVKVVWRNGNIAGIAALGHGVSHLVTAAQLLLLGQYHGDALNAFMFAHPTLDEALHAALEAPQEVFAA